MKTNIQKISYAFIALTLVFAISCGGSSSSEKDEHEHTEAESHDMEEKEHSHSDEMGDSMIGKAYTWMAKDGSIDMFEYKTDNVMMMKHGEVDVLMLIPNEKNASFMFKNKQGNVGVTATIKLDGSECTVKLIHHSTGKDNYEFVALEGTMMKLGRVENGEEKILDSKEIEVPQDWFTLTVTAAGTHYKGYINDKMITHGHADEMESGFVGIVASGGSSISVKKVEVTPLEDEH